MKAKRLVSKILLLTLWLSVAMGQVYAQQPALASSKADNAPDSAGKINSSTLLARVWQGRRAGISLVPSSRYPRVSGLSAPTTASSPAVLGSGTVGRISMWAGTHPSGNSILGDSIITQLNGNIGVGLTMPTSKLTVQGMIETTLGGYKFPDGTIQTTAAVSGLQMVFHDSTLQGDGTSGSSLGVAIPLSLTGSVPGFSNYILTVGNTGMAAMACVPVAATVAAAAALA